MIYLAQKLQFLHDCGYNLFESTTHKGAVVGMHKDTHLGITLHENTIAVDNVAVTGPAEKTTISVEGWQELTLDGFKMICTTMGLVPARMLDLNISVQLAQKLLHGN